MQTEQRHNASLSAAVEHGIWLAESQGSAIAWAYMQTYKAVSYTHLTLPTSDLV